MREELRRAAVAGDAAGLAVALEDGRLDERDRYGQTALMLAARHGREAAVALLVERGAALDATAKYGLSALMLAIVNGHEAVARRLVAAGADLSIRGTGAPGFAGRTARDLAAAAGLKDLAAEIAQAEGQRGG